MNRRLQVMTAITTSQRFNAYEVHDCLLRQCPHCDAGDNDLSDLYCSHCGYSLSDSPVIHPSYLLRETIDGNLFDGEGALARNGMAHPGLANVHQYFEERPYGPQPRYYLLSDLEQGIGLTQVTQPQREQTVFGWALQIAQALAYLHENGVYHRNIRPENIRVAGQHARLTNFGQAETQPPYAAPEWVAARVLDDIGGLARGFMAFVEQAMPMPTLAAILSGAIGDDGSASYTDARSLAEDLAASLADLERIRDLVLSVGFASDAGQKRELNEDSLLAVPLELMYESLAHPVGLFAVADGMGGHSAGEVASRLAVNGFIQAALSRIMPPAIQGDTGARTDFAALLDDAVQAANRAVYEMAQDSQSDMGTTLVAVLTVGDQVFVANVGDSRAYRLSGGVILQITTDHSVVEHLIAAGQISREEARDHPNRSAIYRMIGDGLQLEVDRFETQMRVGDWIVLCSDGLNGMLTDAEINEVVISTDYPQSACDELVRRANDAGGEDNITVIVIHMQERGSAGPAPAS